MPLYGVTHKKTKEFIPIWSKDEWIQYNDSEYYKHRFKGLGEMGDREMKAMLDRRNQIAIPVILDDKDIQILKDLMTSPQLKKQLLIEKGILR
jgi:DNA gyrase/topoisomerase IV subunit B